MTSDPPPPRQRSRTLSLSAAVAAALALTAAGIDYLASDSEPHPGQPAPQASGTDPVEAVTLALVVVVVLGMTGYLCVTHPALTDAVSAVGEVVAALVAVFAVVVEPAGGAAVPCSRGYSTLRPDSHSCCWRPMVVCAGERVAGGRLDSAWFIAPDMDSGVLDL